MASSSFSTNLNPTSSDERYWLCRKSLRIWPVPGADKKKALGSYLTDKLKLSSRFLKEIGEISIKTVAAAPGSKIDD